MVAHLPDGRSKDRPRSASQYASKKTKPGVTFPSAPGDLPYLGLGPDDDVSRCGTRSV